MSNPIHSPKVEAELVALESLRRVALAVRADQDGYTPAGLSPAYRRDVANHLAKKYNKALDESGFDGLHLSIEEKQKRSY